MISEEWMDFMHCQVSYMQQEFIVHELEFIVMSTNFNPIKHQTNIKQIQVAPKLE